MVSLSPQTLHSDEFLESLGSVTVTVTLKIRQPITSRLDIGKGV